MYVVQLHLVEERHFAGHGMSQHCTAALAYSKFILAMPLAGHAGLAAGVLDNCPIFGAKEPLPTYVKPFEEVAKVDQAFFFECLSIFGIKSPLLLSTFGHCRRTSHYYHGYQRYNNIFTL